MTGMEILTLPLPELSISIPMLQGMPRNNYPFLFGRTKRYPLLNHDDLECAVVSGQGNP